MVMCITKFQGDLLNQKFSLRIDCKSAKEVLQKDVQNIASNKLSPDGYIKYFCILK